MKRTVWMMAAVGIVLLGLAACGSAAPVPGHDCACTDKSYPRFWTDLSALKTVPAAEKTELE